MIIINNVNNIIISTGELIPTPLSILLNVNIH
jgi:hypothetical protein